MGVRRMEGIRKEWAWTATNSAGRGASARAFDRDRDKYSGLASAATLYVLGRPGLVPDYNRDGKINDDDDALVGEKAQRFWVNDDRDSKDTNTSKNDRPGSGPNGRDSRVNGRCDLLDFTPVMVDISGVFPPGTPAAISNSVTWRLESTAVNAVWTSLAPANAGSFLTNSCGETFGPALSQPAHHASVTDISAGWDFPAAFLRRVKGVGGGKGVVMVEGRTAGNSLKLAGCDSSSRSVAEAVLDVEISPVRDMFRWINVRGLSGENVSPEYSDRLGPPGNLPDGEKDPPRRLISRTSPGSGSPAAPTGPCPAPRRGTLAPALRRCIPALAPVRFRTA